MYTVEYAVTGGRIKGNNLHKGYSCLTQKGPNTRPGWYIMVWVYRANHQEICDCIGSFCLIINSVDRTVSLINHTFLVFFGILFGMLWNNVIAVLWEQYFTDKLFLSAWLKVSNATTVNSPGETFVGNRTLLVWLCTILQV